MVRSRGVAICSVVAVCACVVWLGCVFAGSAFAAQPWWGVQSGSVPTVLSPGGEGEVVITVENLGDQALSGKERPVSITDTLPQGITATGVVVTEAGEGNTRGSLKRRSVGFKSIECPKSFPSQGLSSVTCSWSSSEPLEPYEVLEIILKVKVSEHAVEGSNRIGVSGGEGYRCVASEEPGEGAYSNNFCLAGYKEPGDYEAEYEESEVAPASSVHVLHVGSSAVSFGVESYDFAAEEENGSLDTQAGSHPFQLTTSIAFNNHTFNNRAPALPREVQFEWPAGLVGNPTAIPECSEAQFSDFIGGQASNACPLDTVIGVASITAQLGNGVGGEANEFKARPETYLVPVFNLVPSPGEPARAGFELAKTEVFFDTSVRNGRDYGVNVEVHNITQLATFISSRVTIWGVPADPAHDNARGWNCAAGGASRLTEFSACTPLGATSTPPFLTMPTACTGPLSALMHAYSWKEPYGSEADNHVTYANEEPMGELDGCNRLPFSAEIGVAPDVQEASSPTGLTVNVHVPQEAVLAPNGLADAVVKNTVVTLPEGVAIDPAGANGLEACSEGEVGYLGKEEAEPTANLFTPSIGEPFCPDAAKIATASIRTPLLPKPLEGAVYLATQDTNPFGSLVAMYIVAEDREAGVLAKVAGEVKLTATGQLITSFDHDPQVPLENIELHFFGGERAPLSTPSKCGTYTTNAVFTPWSGNAPISASSSFKITSGPDNTPCPGANLPFSPSLTAGTTSIQAGGFSPFTMTMSREDGQQNLQAISLKMPPGLSGLLTGLKLCGETEADDGTCGPESLIGETIVSVGLGGDPYSVTGGKVYITGPYDGAPFGLSIVNPAKAGPYNLGQVVVRAKIEVNPITSQLTVTSDDEGPYRIPQYIDGIPLEIKHVNVTINRPGFTFNPTNCDPMQITGSLDSTEGSNQALSVPFQATNCATLSFKPGFAVSTSGKTSRANGASLHVKLTYPKAAFGTQANISKVKVDLPKQLPSRLTTLQKACTAATFNANPASCPAASKVGSATATTPLIPVPLQGPAYFVSYGGAKFPELVVVLQGYGVTVDLHGETFINAATNITSSTFRTIPDVPVGSFELTLPQGPYSALAAIGNLCKSTLKMPTAFTAQNGTEIHESTPITTTGCPKHKAKPHAKSKHSNEHKHGR